MVDADVIASAVGVNRAGWNSFWIGVSERLSSPASSVLLALVSVKILDRNSKADEFY